VAPQKTASGARRGSNRGKAKIAATR